MRLLVDLATAFLLLCAGTSILVAIVHPGLGFLLDRLPPKWRARMRFSALVAPFTVGSLGVIIALLPSFWHAVGIANDHCLNVHAHAHGHLCFIHQPTSGSRLLAAIVLGSAIVLLVRVTLLLDRWWRARRILMSVVATSAVHPLGGRAYLLSSDIPVCVTTGLLRPTIYFSSGAAAALGPDCIRAALAHEHGHVVRHETRARFLGALAETFHLPGLGRSITQRWQEDAELVCDLLAARQVGSATLVAEALVRFQRALLRNGATPICAAACFCPHGSPLTARITTLLATNVERADALDDRDGRLAYHLGLIALLVGLGLQARPLHHALESFVGFLVSALASAPPF